MVFLVSLSDRKFFDVSTGSYEGVVKTAFDYYPFGLTMPGRSLDDDQYRHGFNGKENDRDIADFGLIQDYGFRLYNPAVGKFLSVDPLSASYPYYTPYQFAGNMPVWAIDIDGLEPGLSTTQEDKDNGVYASGEVEFSDEAKFQESSFEFDGFKFESIKEKDGSVYWSINRIEKRHKNLRCNGSNPQMSYVVTPEGFKYFMNNIEEYRDKSLNQFNYNLTWGRMDETRAGRMIKGYMLGRAADGALNLIFKGASFIAKGGKLLLKSSNGFKNSIKTVDDITPELVQKALESGNLSTKQISVSLPMIKKYYQKLLNNEVAPAISVTTEGVIVEGNHRYIAGLLHGTLPAIKKGTEAGFKKTMPVLDWKKIQFTDVIWK